MTQDKIIRISQVNELIKESARLIASTSDEGDRYLTAVDTLRNAYRLGLKDATLVAAQERENVQMVRAITLEEAAQLCMDYGREGFSAHVIARAIREMK